MKFSNLPCQNDQNRIKFHYFQSILNFCPKSTGNYNQSNDPPIQFDGLRSPYDDAADRYQREREAR